MKLIFHVACWFFSLAGPYLQPPMILKELQMEGFIVSRWNHRREEGLQALLKWVVEVRNEGAVVCKVYSHCRFHLCKRSLVIAV